MKPDITPAAEVQRYDTPDSAENLKRMGKDAPLIITGAGQPIDTSQAPSIRYETNPEQAYRNEVKADFEKRLQMIDARDQAALSAFWEATSKAVQKAFETRDEALAEYFTEVNSKLAALTTLNILQGNALKAMILLFSYDHMSEEDRAGIPQKQIEDAQEVLYSYMSAQQAKPEPKSNTDVQLIGIVQPAQTLEG